MKLSIFQNIVSFLFLISVIYNFILLFKYGWVVMSGYIMLTLYMILIIAPKYWAYKSIKNKVNQMTEVNNEINNEWIKDLKEDGDKE